MKITLSVLALLGALTILPAALADASASSAGASCDASCGQCDPGSCPVPCGGSCSLP